MSQKCSWRAAYGPEGARLSRDPRLSLASPHTANSQAPQGDRYFVSAARRSTSTTRRTLLTATAAGTLLGALWFVPSANATQHAPGEQTSTSLHTSTETDTAEDTTATGTQLADTGAVNTTPYVVGGTLFLCLGAGFVAYSVRRERMDL
ncbi:hypothetical protein GCM10022206_05600 [Streptomyces chiangmaiensis]